MVIKDQDKLEQEVDLLCGSCIKMSKFSDAGFWYMELAPYEKVKLDLFKPGRSPQLICKLFMRLH